MVDSKRQAAPAYSFGQRHKPRTESFSPGPLYNITGLGCKGKDAPPAYCLQSRPKEIPKYLTPAPGEYNIEKADKMLVKSAPKYTFGVKKPPNPTSQTPGSVLGERSDCFHPSLVASVPGGGYMWGYGGN